MYQRNSLKEKVACMCRIKKGDKAVISQGDRKGKKNSLWNMQRSVKEKENYIVP